MRIDKCFILNRILRVFLSWLTVYSLIAAYLMYMGEGLRVIAVLFLMLIILCTVYLFFAKNRSKEIVMQPGLMIFNLVAIILCSAYQLDLGLNFEIFGLIIVIAGYLTNSYLASYYQFLHNAGKNESRALMSNFKNQNLVFFSWLSVMIIVSMLTLLIPYSGLGAAIIKGIRSLILFLRGEDAGYTDTGTYQTYTEEEGEQTELSGEGSGSAGYLLVIGFIALIILIVGIIILRKTLAKAGNKRGDKKNAADDDGIIETVMTIKKDRKVSTVFSIFGTPAERIRKYFIRTVRSVHDKKIKTSDTPAELILEATAEDRQLRDYYELARYSNESITSDDVKRVKKLSENIRKKNRQQD